MNSLKVDIAETREILGEEYATVPDESIEMMLHTFRLLAKAILRSIKEESL